MNEISSEKFLSALEVVWKQAYEKAILDEHIDSNMVNKALKNDIKGFFIDSSKKVHLMWKIESKWLDHYLNTFKNNVRYTLWFWVISRQSENLQEDNDEPYVHINCNS